MKVLQGKVAVITGAGRGIGKAIGIGFCRAGASVVCAARTEREVLEAAMAMKLAGGDAVGRMTDVTYPDSVNSLFEFAHSTFGGVDIVVANAGINMPKATVEESDREQWKAVMETNLFGAYYTAKAAVPYLRARGGGHIIMVGSGLGHRGLPERSAYAVSKAGLWMLTRVLAQEVAADQINVNELIPGPAQTAMASTSSGEMKEDYGQHERRKKPEDVVPLAVFLASQPPGGPTCQSFSLMRREG
ncbi:MAG: SDR family oxidoreductase [Candidatus Promineifilaceae bacterium]|nr:SDR family oxidoreductase [Candidatus Promineifilaceae bacterium]